jgi:hypothetical protein
MNMSQNGCGNRANWICGGLKYPARQFWQLFEYESSARLDADQRNWILICTVSCTLSKPKRDRIIELATSRNIQIKSLATLRADRLIVKRR